MADYNRCLTQCNLFCEIMHCASFISMAKFSERKVGLSLLQKLFHIYKAFLSNRFFLEQHPFPPFSNNFAKIWVNVGKKSMKKILEVKFSQGMTGQYCGLVIAIMNLEKVLNFYKIAWSKTLFSFIIAYYAFWEFFLKQNFLKLP